jgi:glycosyltransferase involved in cell wall biosynthesis
MIKPQISVIISTYNAKGTIVSCLQSLINQVTDKRFEIIVVDSSTDGTAELIQTGFPSVRLYRFAERKFCGDARNFAISVAKADIIALIDGDCTAENNWIEELFKTHETPHLAIGGAIANGLSNNYVSCAAYFCEFSQWMPNTPETWLDDVAGANMSYKLKVFTEFGRFIEGTYCSDTEFHGRLKEKGHLIKFMPSILINHFSIDNFLEFITHEYFHGCNFAQVRLTATGFSKFRRILYAIGFPLISVKLFLDIMFRNLNNRTYMKLFFKVSPLVFLGVTSWALGEGVGYIKG